METVLETLSKDELIALVKQQHVTVSGLSEENTSLNTKINSLNADVDSLSSHAASLNAKVGSLSLSEVSLNANVTSLNANVTSLNEKVEYLKSQVEMYKRMQFGQKRERFLGDPAQTTLPFQATAKESIEQDEILEQKIASTRKRPNHKGRAALPSHLPVEEIEIYPEGDLSEMVCIGKDITEELECEPARFFIKRYIRYKYALKGGQGIRTGALPERVIDKGIPGAGLLALIVTDKYMDHLPLYRQKQRLAREGIRIASSTMDGWTRETLLRLEPLYEQLVFDIKKQGYLQCDETPIKVLDSEKKGSSHQGWYWVYHSPLDKTVLFDYSPTRGAVAPLSMLGNFTGYLQSDGYAVYQKYGARKGVTHLACWAHARREFDRALDNDKKRATTALTLIQKLYAVERKAREENLEPETIKELRLKESLPVINELGKWIFQEIKSTLPKSQIGKAMAYAMARWDALSAYLYDGNLQIDNNLCENALRPIPLGRKNYLFAGSHEAAQRAAMIYSFFAICKKHEVNPYKWLKYTLENIMSINHKKIKDLYPQNFAKLSLESNM